MFCFVDYKISEVEKNNLIKLGLYIIEVPKCPDVYNAINGHVDIQLCILDCNNKLVLINKSIPNHFKEKLKNLNINFLESKDAISSPYPKNISLNALITKDYFIHKLDSSDKNLLDYFSNTKTLINVKQGYTKCSCLFLKEKVLITNDSGIYNTLIKYGFDILLLPYGDIILEDFEYGFIGGVGGMISNSQLALFGNLDFYLYGDLVKSFLEKHNIEPIYLCNSKLIDRGSLFVI